MKLKYELNSKIVTYNDFFLFCLKSYSKGKVMYNRKNHTLYYERN